MPRVKLTKTVIDALPTPPCDIVYWDAALPGFGVKRQDHAKSQEQHEKRFALVGSGKGRS